jgi:hypothetical protein
MRTRPAPPPAASIASPLKLGLKATEYSTWSGCGSGSTTTVLSTSARRTAADRSLPTGGMKGRAGVQGGCAGRTYRDCVCVSKVLDRIDPRDDKLACHGKASKATSKTHITSLDTGNISQISAQPHSVVTNTDSSEPWGGGG